MQKMKQIDLKRKQKEKDLDRIDKKLLLLDYHKWLEQERLKDKKKVSYKAVNKANYFLSKLICPYCKKKIKIVEKEGVMSKVCKKHGILAVKKTEWNIWSEGQNKTKGENK